MYSLELDLELYFVPPMEDFGNGVALTRTLDLPFVPHSGLIVFGRELDDCPVPGGIPLKDVTWDVDRRVFLAKSTVALQDWPIVAIPDEIGQWVYRGWRLGSYLEQYEEDEDRLDVGGPELDIDLTAYCMDEDDWPELTKLQATCHRSRPREFNILFQLVIRLMAERYNNLPTAYAMYKTQRFIAQRESGVPDDPAARQFRAAKQDFKAMAAEQQAAWIRKVKRKYPSLPTVVR